MAIKLYDKDAYQTIFEAQVKHVQKEKMIMILY